MALVDASVAQAFLLLLDTEPDVFEVEAFLRQHVVIVEQAFHADAHTLIKWSPHLDVLVPDLCVGHKTHEGYRWSVVIFETPLVPIFLAPRKPISSIANSISELELLRSWIENNSEAARSVLADLKADFDAVILAGNRYHLMPREDEHLQDMNRVLRGIRLYTYQWLLDGAI